jgi:anaerobic selenocysteine-containing dehydrogenase
MPGDKEILKTTCPRDCYDGCGIAVIKRGGKITKVLGNPDHPTSRGALCGKCAVAYNGAWLDDKARLLHPLRRSGPKGSGQFEPISWDDALGEIAGKLHAISDEHGADKIVHTHYTGTCSSLAYGFPQRFFNRLGATEVDPDTICNNAGHAAWGYVFGDSHTGFDPRTAKDANCILVWGANPSASAPHAHKVWLRESPAQVIVVDPVRHETAAEADIFLQPFPGSDAALAFAMLHVMRRDGMFDDGYIAAHVLGFDEVAPMLDGCTPQWGEAQTGVPAGDIERAAKLYGAGPSLMWLGQGLQRQPQGGNIFRALAMLPAFTGNIGKPGAGFYYLNDSVGIAHRKGAAPAYEPPSEPKDAPAPISQMDVPALLQDANRIRAYMVWNCNPVASNPRQADMRHGLAREDLFTVVVDCFQTDTADYADIVLPAASFLEFDDIGASYFHFTYGPLVKCQEPMGESLPNQEIFRRLSRAMGFEDKHLYEDDRSVIDKTLKHAGLGIGWDELKAKGWARLGDEPLILWAEGKFPTPSGKIEIASARAEADGHPRVPQPTADPRPGGDRFRLLSPADKWLMNSSYGNDPRIGELMGPPNVAIHPDDAGRLGVAEGDHVRLANEAGALDFTARLTDEIPAGVLLTHKSRWPKMRGDGANVNLLHIPEKTDMGESTSVHATEVTVQKVA